MKLILILFIFYSVSHVWILNLSNALFWDDWVVNDTSNEIIVKTSLMKGNPLDSIIHIIFGYLGYPIYRFSTDDIVAEIGNNSVARSSIDMINVVPNPYYGYSEYETNQLDNRIKITNLPQKATISIFTLSGTLVRTLKKDDSSISSIDWDLKNDYGIPIASGLYVIHVKTNEGEKVLKWFGALRPIDLATF